MSQTSAPRNLVSVVIVNFNGVEYLEPCLRSVFRQPYRPMEVIVVDNGSSDGSVATVETRFPEVRLIRNATNRGFAGANNQGAAAARGEFVALLNNDTEVSDVWLEELVRWMNDPSVAVVTSRVVTDGVPQQYYEMNGTINYLGYNVMRHFTDLSRIFFAGGASLMYRRAQIGPPFPDEYFLYHEDVYLSWRMRLQGFDVRMSQESSVQHRGSVTTRRQPGSVVTFYQERNRLLNALFFYNPRSLVTLLPYFLADLCSKFILSVLLRRKSTTGILRAYAWCALHAGWVYRERQRLQHERRVPDAAILRLMSPRVVDSEGLPARLVNGLSRIYARVTGLAQ